MTFSCAESCTGGMIGALLTSEPGSSRYFLGSAVVYSNESKSRILGVSSETIGVHGAVSEETAREMAVGSNIVFGSDVSMAVTGIAGPDGGTETKPVGLVYIAVADGPRPIVSRFVFEGDRTEVRRRTVDAAIGMVLELLEGRL